MSGFPQLECSFDIEGQCPSRPSIWRLLHLVPVSPQHWFAPGARVHVQERGAVDVGGEHHETIGQPWNHTGQEFHSSVQGEGKSMFLKSQRRKDDSMVHQVFRQCCNMSFCICTYIGKKIVCIFDRYIYIYKYIFFKFTLIHANAHILCTYWHIDFDCQRMAIFRSHVVEYI